MVALLALIRNMEKTATGEPNKGARFDIYIPAE